MIVDCNTRVWETVQQLGRTGSLWPGRDHSGGRPALPKAGPDDHLSATEPVDQTFVLAFKSHYLEAEVPNDFVADYVRQHPDRLVGFAAVDPSRPVEAVEDLRRAHGQLNMQGVTIWPAAQDVHPASTAAMQVHAEACRLKMPVMFHQDVPATPASRMEFARPFLIDEVAREFPDLKIIISQMGYPWTEETIVLLAKHRNVFSEISSLLCHPWKAYNTLLTAYQAGVMDALLFGSNFPFTSAATCIESLYSINQCCHGTNMPTIPREQLRQIVERDALSLLGIESRGKARFRREVETVVIENEE